MSGSWRPRQEFADLQAGWARSIAQSLVDCGVRDVVVSPGSRSTPLVLSFSEHPGLTCTSIADERSAGFYALGQARASGRPSALLCTSGSAPGHYLPAVMEAASVGVPLVVLSANRPPERDQCGAPQTTNQRNLFGEHSRGFFEIPVADGQARIERAAIRMVAQAVSLSTSPEAPGPVQVDVRLRKPLQPSVDVPQALAAEKKQAPAQDDEPSLVRVAPKIVRSIPAAEAVSVERLATVLLQAERPLLVAGPANLTAAGVDRRNALSRLLGFGIPAALEWSSQLRLDHSLRSMFSWMQVPEFRETILPDLVLQIGQSPVSGGFEPWIEKLTQSSESAETEKSTAHWILADTGYPDPLSTAEVVLLGDVEGILNGVVERLEAARGAGDDAEDRAGGMPAWEAWREKLEAIDQAGQQIIDAHVGDGVSVEDADTTSPSMSEGRVARIVTRTLPRGGLLAVGNSLAIRLLEAYGDPGFAQTSEAGESTASVLRGCLWHQRGLNGIDGILSGVAGSLSVLERNRSDNEPRPFASHLLLGDVSFVHDVGGLAMLQGGACNGLTVIVIDNGGGRIFDRLPVAALGLDAQREGLFSTPPAIDIEQAARAFGLIYAEATTAEELERLLGEDRRRGARVVRVQTEAGGEVVEHRSLLAALSSALPSALSSESTALQAEK